MRSNRDNNQDQQYAEKVVSIRRVSKKTKGGNQMSFTSLVVVGDKQGKVGVALGKAPDVVSGIKKGVRLAKKRFIQVPLQGTTIPFPMEYKHGGAQVLLKPAPKGSGIIAGGAIRAVVEAAGISDVVGKILNSNNQINNVYATYHALKKIGRVYRLKEKAGIIKEEDTKKNQRQPKKAKQAEKKSAPKKAAKKSAPKKTSKSKSKSSAKKTEKKTGKSTEATKKTAKAKSKKK